MGNRISIRKGSGRRPVEERLTRPRRLVLESSNVDYKKLRKLILSEKLAPCFDGAEESNPDLEECPICFFVIHSSKNRIFFYGFWLLATGFLMELFWGYDLQYFPSLNRSKCCMKGICTGWFSLFSATWVFFYPLFCYFGFGFLVVIDRILFLFYLVLQNAFCR